MDYEEVKEQFDTAKSHYKDLYNACEDDWNFLHGKGQWDTGAEKDRKASGKPVLVLNQLMPYAHQVVNDIRQARLAVRVTPVDNDADKDTAEVLSGLVRNIERTSNALNAYTTASLNAVGAGIGWIRLGAQYTDEQTFDQEPYIDRILDFRSVYIDPASEALDGSDAEYCFIETTMPLEVFEERYPDADTKGFDDTGKEGEVCVVEHYYKHYDKDTLYRVKVDQDIINTHSEGLESLDAELVPYEIIDERPVSLPKVYHCIYGAEEDPLEKTEFPSKYIPIVPVIGQEVYIDNERQFHSLIRQAKDAQMMYNYHKSESTYMLALQPKAPVIGAEGSFASDPQAWSDSNRKSIPYLEYKVIHDENGQRVEPPTRMPPIQGSQSVMAEAMGAREDIRLALGMPQANMGETVGDLSGVAIRNKQIEGDNATFHFVDNLATSITQVGRILVDMIPRLYSEAKILRILGEDGQEENIPVNQPFAKTEDGKIPASKNTNIDGIYDLGAGKYDVVCDVGASYSSQRQETADKLIQLVAAKPEIAEVTADLLFEALDLPDSHKIAERLRANMNPALLGDDPQAAKLQEAAQMVKQLEEQIMNYEAALQSKQENQAFEQQVKTQELQQENQKLMIEAEKAKAEIAKINAEAAKTASEITTGKDLAALMQRLEALSERSEEQRETIEIMLDAKERELNEATSEPIESETD